MDILLSPELEVMVNEKVRSGRYPSASEVVQEGLRLLLEQDTNEEFRLQRLRQDVQAGFEQIERGECNEYFSAEELTEKLVAKGRG